MIVGITKVRNESLIIEDTLCHYLRLTEHVVMYDDDSTDNTVELASKFKNVSIIKGTKWHPDRDTEETQHRANAHYVARQIGATWCLCFDADERIVGELPPLTNPWRFGLFDAYMTPKLDTPYIEGPLSKLPRLFGPERRNITMLFPAKESIFVGPDQREPVCKAPAKIAPSTFVKHYGKSISRAQFEETCHYYMKWPKYAKKWEARLKEGPIHTTSDFGRTLYTWDHLMQHPDTHVVI